MLVKGKVTLQDSGPTNAIPWNDHEINTQLMRFGKSIATDSVTAVGWNFEFSTENHISNSKSAKSF